MLLDISSGRVSWLIKRNMEVSVLVEYERTLATGTGEQVDKSRQRKEFVTEGSDEEFSTDAQIAEILNATVVALTLYTHLRTLQNKLELAGERKGTILCAYRNRRLYDTASGRTGDVSWISDII